MTEAVESLWVWGQAWSREKVPEQAWKLGNKTFLKTKGKKEEEEKEKKIEIIKFTG